MKQHKHFKDRIKSFGLDYILRQATQEDAIPIETLIHRVRINPRNLDWRRFWVAVDPVGNLLGCGQIKPHDDGSFELASIAVQPEVQGQGIGKAIMEKLLTGSPRPLYLICRAALTPYYEKFGFREVFPEEITPSYRTLWRIIKLLRYLPSTQLQGRIMIKPT